VFEQESCPTNTPCYCPLVGVCELYNYTLDLNSLVVKHTHIGLHNREYYFTIIVTNNARLVSVQHVDVLADDSPPAPGVVLEGPVDSPDIDYTSQDSILVHWHGFIDHESGIRLYKVGLASRCLSVDELQKRPDNGTVIVESTETSVSFSISSSPGKIYFSVLAFNNAMAQSPVVCSDGITQDKTSPTVSDFVMKRAMAKEILYCKDGDVWVVLENLTRVALEMTRTCLDRCKMSPKWLVADVLPIINSSAYDSYVSDDFCTRLPMFTDNWYIYIPSDNIELTWNATDDTSQLRNIYVGFSSDTSALRSPDIESYQEVHSLRRYKNSHEGLDRGIPFYINIRVVNKAGLETIIPFGPVIIDETPPVFTDGLEVTIQDRFVYLTWQNETFRDLEQQHPIDTVIFRIGTLLCTYY
jgi:hypothetical protein